MKKTIGIMLSLLLCAALILPACAESAVTITLSQSALEIGTGGKIKLEVNTESTEKLKYTWETSDKKIASVDGKGTVSGVAEGEATVTCSAVLGKDVVATAECKVTVYTSIKTVKAASPLKGNQQRRKHRDGGRKRRGDRSSARQGQHHLRIQPAEPAKGDLRQHTVHGETAGG